MKHYYIIDIMKSGDWFGGDSPLTGIKDRFDAIKRSDLGWGQMTEYDRGRRETFFLCYAPEDQDGCCDFEKADIIKRYC